MIPLKYKHDDQLLSSVFTTVSNWENNGMEEIGLVTSTPVVPH